MEALRRIGIGVGGIAVFVGLVYAIQTGLRGHVSNLVAGVLLVLVMPLIYAGYVWLTEHRAVSELALRPLIPQVLLGLLIGVAIFAAAIGIIALFGHYRVVRIALLPGLGTALLLMFAVAIAEEIVFRGYVFRVTQSIGGTWIAIAVSALLFGLAHSFNPGATALTDLAIAVEAGILLAAAYAATGRLWLPIGIHAGWNFAEGSIFGTSVSGHTAHAGIVHGVLQGNAAWTGAAFGVEGSLPAVLIALAAAVMLLVVSAKRRTT